MKTPLLLHICCAPDEAWVVHTLKDQYDLHCFFCNPNISPQSEYDLRLHEASNVAMHYNVPFTSDSYNPASWEQTVLPHQGTPEGGERCRHCFFLRLERSSLECKRLGIPRFATVMSISPHKRVTMLDEEGLRAALLHDVAYVAFDFKKNNGFQKSIELSRTLGLYRQDYCGCILSRNERDERIRLRVARQNTPRNRC